MSAPAGAGETIQAAWTWTGERFESGTRIEIDGNGVIAAVDSAADPPEITPEPRRPLTRLGRSALLPGFVNAHSHAFQRGLRGRGEGGGGTAGDFWGWRDSMYRLVDELDERRFYELTLGSFREMRAQGITAVGEFHYLHHVDGSEGFELDDRVLEAASEAGVRLVLLEAFYRTGGIGRPLCGAQRRFATRSIDRYWRQLEALEGRLDPATQSLGVVAHSIRSASPPEIGELGAEASRRRLVFHLHAEEQRREIEESIAEYGAGPLAILQQQLETASGVTAVHCTHSTPTDLARFAVHGGSVCVCPTTEANLADGIPDLPAFLASGGSVCLGTDSNLRISMTEEMRWLEQVQRLARERRGVVAGPDGDVGAALLQAATRAGARALGLGTGRIAKGAPADLVEIDLEHPALEGWSQETLVPSLIFGGGDEAVLSTCVGGKWRTHRQRARP